jgi:hypothetical protein
VLLDHPLFRLGGLAMGAGQLAGDKMTSAPIGPCRLACSPGC